MLGTIGAAVSAAKTAAAVAMPAKAPDAGGFYTWLTGSPMRVLLAIVGASVVVGAMRGRLTKSVVTLLIVCVGLFIVYGDVAMKGIADWLGSYVS